MYGALGNLLFCLDPERAHSLSITALKWGIPRARPAAPSARLTIEAAGLTFPNPLGLAAGYDKNGEVPDALLAMGFGFVEVGTVTPRPQQGNPRPRVFRLVRDRAVINRLGFNNDGRDAVLRRLQSRIDMGGIVGVNIGANRDSDDRIRDYVDGIEAFGAVASYFTINISSPNTPGLRDLQARDRLSELLSRCVAARHRLARHVPIFVKLAPDLSEADLDDIAAEIGHHAIEGIVVSNTTLDRRGLSEGRLSAEGGGLSGVPLFEKSTIVLAKMRRRLGPSLVMIGAGGVDSTQKALEKIRAGADLVQIYTGLVYEGPFLPRRIVAGLDRFAESEGLKSIREIRDSHLADWAGRRITAD